MSALVEGPRRSISPPPSKRRRIEELSGAAAAPRRSSTDEISIYSWNVNGIEPFVQAQITSFFRPRVRNASARSVRMSPNNLRDVLQKYAWPALFFLQEVKISSTDTATQRAVQKAVARADTEPLYHPSYKAFFCLPRDPHNARGFGGKVYGVCTLVRTDFYDDRVENVREVDWDKEGRFLVCETRQIGSCPKLAIFNIYAVNGTDHPYKDCTGKVVGTRHERKLQVHLALENECRQLESRGVQIVLAGDINVARSQLDGYPNLRTRPEQHCLNRADFERRFLGPPSDVIDQIESLPEDAGKESGLGMIDTFRHLYPDQARYTYYPRGRPYGSSCDRVDMILISRSLEARLRDAGMRDTPADRGPSDHVPLYCTLADD